MTSPQGTPADSDTIDFGRALRFVPEDPEWIPKILIGGAFTLLGYLLVGVFFVAGYLVRLVRRSAAGEPRPLPQWDDFGGLFMDGLRAVGLYLAYLAIAMVIPGSLGCVLVIMGGGMGALSGARDASEAAGAAVAMGGMVLYVVTMLAILVLSLYLPSAFVRFALLDSFGAGFEVRENLEFIRRNLGNYLLSLVLYIVASFVAQFGIILCCIGVFPASFWAVCILGWALGDSARRDAVLKGGALAPRW